MATLTTRLRAIPSWQVTLGLALLALGFLIAAQLSAERPRVRYTSQERTPLLETAIALQRRQDGLKTRILELRTEIGKLEGQGKGNAALARELNAELEAARIAAGLIALEGTGVVLRLEDSADALPADGNVSDYIVTAHDIRTVVEELWLAGAEAIAVNGERVTIATAFLDIGGSVLVNSAYVAGPFQVAAIGPEDLYDRLSTSVGFADFVAARAGGFGILISFAEPATVVVPAYAGTVRLRYARANEPSSSGAP